MGLLGRKEQKIATEEVRIGYRELEGAGSSTVSSWVPGGLVRIMGAKVAAGEYGSKPEFVLAAVRYYADYLECRDRRQ